jgi:hypothetical protein
MRTQGFERAADVAPIFKKRRFGDFKVEPLRRKVDG